MNAKNIDLPGQFICQRKDQLGARLLMILNSIRLSDDFGCDYRINWFPKGAAAPKLSNPTDLFSQDYIDRKFITNDELEAQKGRVAPLYHFAGDAGPDKLFKHLSAGNHVLLDEGFEVAVLPWEDHKSIEERYPEFIRRMGFNELILTKMAAVEAALEGTGDRSVAYHVRRGDILNEAPWRDGMWPSKIEADEMYFKHLEVENPKAVLVFSDLEDSVGRMQARHENVRGINDLVDISDCQPVQCDFLELYAMSRAGQIVAPVISAFSSAAARLSGRDRLRFVDVLKPDQLDAAYDDLAARLAKDLESFAGLSEAAHVFSRLSRHLAMNDRENEGYDIGQSLIGAGADNAFLPLLHAVNCIYFSKWEEAKANLLTALSNPGLWKEDFATALALLSHVEASLGNAIAARRLWARAFWLKPHLPDVIVSGTALLERDRLRPGPDLPFDAELLAAHRLPYLQRNILTVQRKLIRRAPVDLSLLVIEWRHCVLDRKSQRDYLEAEHLKRIRSRIEAGDKSPGSDSFAGLLQCLIGNFGVAEDLSVAALRALPDDFLVNKRYAEVLWMTGQSDLALAQLIRLTELEPDNPFGHFLLGKFLRDQGDPARALAHLKKAASLDRTTAAIHAELAYCHSDLGKHRGAVKALARASELAPTFQKFANQRARISRKVGRNG